MVSLGFLLDWPLLGWFNFVEKETQKKEKSRNKTWHHINLPNKKGSARPKNNADQSGLLLQTSEDLAGEGSRIVGHSRRRVAWLGRLGRSGSPGWALLLLSQDHLLIQEGRG